MLGNHGDLLAFEILDLDSLSVGSGDLGFRG